jgi:hypothetical protein
MDSDSVTPISQTKPVDKSLIKNINGLYIFILLLIIQPYKKVQ